MEESKLDTSAGSHATAHFAQDLEGLMFPATKQEITDYILQHGTCPDKESDRSLLATLEDKTYDSPIQVMAEIEQ